MPNQAIYVQPIRDWYASNGQEISDADVNKLAQQFAYPKPGATPIDPQNIGNYLSTQNNRTFSAAQPFIGAGGNFTYGPDSMQQAMGGSAPNLNFEDSVTPPKGGDSWFADKGNQAMVNTGLSAANLGLNMWSGRKGLKLAQDQFNFNKGLMEENLRNSKTDYNNNLYAREFVGGRMSRDEYEKKISTI